ncbi:MAG: hypothetical protein AVDCRST_MAG31-1712, partial [uncultured Sphingomonas sp.]
CRCSCSRSPRLAAAPCRPHWPRLRSRRRSAGRSGRATRTSSPRPPRRARSGRGNMARCSSWTSSSAAPTGSSCGVRSPTPSGGGARSSATTPPLFVASNWAGFSRLT